MRIGIDLGGTKIEAVVLADDGAIAYRERRATPRGEYEGTIEAIAALVEAAERAVGAAASVGIGMPGAISPATGLVKNANSTWLNGRPLDRDLSARLNRPVRLANDANCFALSEASDGAAAGAGVVFGVIIGTGCGGGVVVNGQVLTGPNAVAGEWGHSPLPWPEPSELPGPDCYCGKRGCLETFLSGPGLVRDYAACARVDAREVDGAAVVSRAIGGDRHASSALERYTNRLARGLATVINLLDPDIIVLGGGMSNVSMLYEIVPGKLRDYVFSDSVSTRIVPPLHGDSSGVRGAAWLWPR
jgi:fructokinase